MKADKDVLIFINELLETIEKDKGLYYLEWENTFDSIEVLQ